MNRLRCRWSAFAGTWLDPAIWVSRVRVLLTPGSPVGWPGIRFLGHHLDTEHPRYEIEDDLEREFLRCTRCGGEVYMGWRPFYGMLR